MKFTLEADLARNGSIDYSTAIQRAYLTRMRYGLAKPYSVIVLGHSDGWFYREGILSYCLGDVIRILDVYNAAVTEDVIDVRSLLSEEARCWPQHIHGIEELLSDELDIWMLDYRDGVLLFRLLDSDSGYLVAINIRKGIPMQERLLTIHECSSDCGAKTDGRYVIVLEDPKRNGRLELFDLEDKRQGIQKRHLSKYIAYSKAVYEIYDGWVYLLTNDHGYQDDASHEGETSRGYNYCYRFPLNHDRSVISYYAAGTDPLPEQLQVVRVPRKQPRTRPDNFPPPRWLWSSLNLWRDEYSGQLIIVEGWHHDGEDDDGESAQFTFQSLQFPEPNSTIDTAMSEEDLFFFGRGVQTLSPADLPRAERDCECPRDPGDRLKARVYVPRVSTFFDVYHGSDGNPDSREKYRFHLAVGLCIRDPPSGLESGQLEKTSRKTNGFPDHNTKRPFVGVRRFPPNDAPKTLLDLLWPTTGKMRINIFSWHDPRSILYSTKRLHRKWDDNAKQMILIDFDPWIRFPGLETMVLHPLSTRLTAGEYEAELVRARFREKIWLTQEVEREREEKREAKWAKLRELHKDDEVEEVCEPKSPWFQTEQAMYLSIGQGFQFS